MHFNQRSERCRSILAHTSTICTIPSVFSLFLVLIGELIFSAISNDRQRFNVIVYLTLQNAVELVHIGKARTNVSL